MRWVAIAAATALAAASGCGGTASTGGETAGSEPGEGETAVVASVGDGDTLRLRDGRRVRLVQIDAPELHGDCYGRASRAALRRLAPEGALVRLERDPALDARDGYGRLLRYVVVAGRNVNLTLVREGAASPYFYRKERGRYARELLEAVDEARRQRRGFWGACPGAELNPGIGSITGTG